MLLKEFKVNKFEQKYKCEKDARMKQRLHILLLLREGYTQREVARMLHVSNGKIPFWKSRFETEGFEGLKDKEGRGVKPEISEEQLSMLRSAMEEPVRTADGYSRGWISKDVRIFIQEQFNLSFTRQHICILIHKIGCSLQVPRPRNKRRNQEAVNQFKIEFKKNLKFWAPEPS